MDLVPYFNEINQKHFDGFLELPALAWNSRLRSSAGRFIPGRRWPHSDAWVKGHSPKIEVAAYLLEEANAVELVCDTLAHEMIHYWLWVRRRPYGHTPEFWKRMKHMGVSRYNNVPRRRPYKYLYQCPGCQGDYHARKKLGPLACAKCCRQHAGGRYDARFRLRLEKELA